MTTRLPLMYKPRHLQNGAETVELALVLSLFFLLLMGLFYGGFVIYTKNELTEAAILGARYGSVHGKTFKDNTTPTPNLTNLIKNTIKSRLNGKNIVINDSDIKVSWEQGVDTSLSNCPTEANPNCIVSVSVQRNMNPSIPFISLPTLQLNSSAKAYVIY